MKRALNKFLAVWIITSLLFSILAPPFARAYELREKSQFTGEYEKSDAVKKFYAAAYHRGPLLKLIENLLSHPKLQLSEKENGEFYKRFIYLMESAISNSKGLAIKLKFEMSQFLSNLETMNQVDSTLLPRLLAERLSQVLKTREVADLTDAELKIKRKIQDRFNLYIDFFNLSDEIKSIRLLVHEEDSLIEDNENYILSPFINLETGEFLYCPHRGILKHLIGIEEPEREEKINQIIDLMVEYELQYYCMIERGVDFDAAHGLLQNTPVFEPLNILFQDVCREILFPSNYARMQTLDGFTLQRVKEFFQDKNFLDMLSQSASTHTGWKVLYYKTGSNSIKFTFEGDRSLSLVADEEHHYWRLRVWGKNKKEENHLQMVGENLSKLLVLQANIPLLKVKEQLLQSRQNLNRSLLENSTLKPLFNLKKIGISPSLIVELFQYDMVPYSLKIDLFDGKEEVSYHALYAALHSNWNSPETFAEATPQISAAIISELKLVPGYEALIQQNLIQTLFRRALQVGLLRLVLGNIGSIELNTLHHTPLHPHDLERLERWFGEEFLLNKILDPEVVNRAIAEGSIIVAGRALLELGFPAEGATLVIQGADGFGRDFFDPAVENNFKVIGLGTVGGLFLKENGFKKYDFSEIKSKYMNRLDSYIGLGNDIKFYYGGESYGRNKDLSLEKPVDILILTGGEGVIRANNYRLEDRFGNEIQIQAKVIVEAVEGALTPEAKELLKKKAKGVVIIPALLATLGETFLAKTKSLGMDMHRPIHRTVSHIFETWSDPKRNPEDLFSLEDAIYLHGVLGLLESKLETDCSFVESVLDEARWKSRENDSEYAGFPESQLLPRTFGEWVRYLGKVKAVEPLSKLLNFMRVATKVPKNPSEKKSIKKE